VFVAVVAMRRYLRHLFFVAVWAVVAASILAPMSAAAPGGTTIAAAPELPLDVTVSGGSVSASDSCRCEYWRLTLKAGDVVTIDYQPTQPGGVDLAFFRPEITDAMIGAASPSETDSTCCAIAREEIWTATAAGRWILRVDSPSAYSLSASVAAGGLTQATGATTIAGAPELPHDVHIVSGAKGETAACRCEYWRVTLNAGDRLTVDYKPVNGHSVPLELYRPEVTDVTIGQTGPSISDSAYSQPRELTWTATGQGAWTLKVSTTAYEILASITPGNLVQVRGGTSVSGASSLPLATTFVGGAIGETTSCECEYWRVPLEAGGRLTLDYQGVNAQYAGVRVYAPTVTDFTLGQTSPTSSDTRFGPARFTFTAPSAGSWLVVLDTNGRGDGYEVTCIEGCVPGPPVLTSFFPLGTAVGDKVALAGVNLTGATSVSLCLVGANFTVVSSTEIDAIVPAAACDGRWRVTTPSGTATTLSSFRTSVPNIGWVSPTTAAVGQSVTLAGSGFSGTSAVSLCFASAAFTVVDENTITAVVPRGACNGKWRVTTAGGTTASAQTAVIATPDVNGFAPNASAVGQSVSITGSGFVNVTAVSLCLVPATFAVVSDTTITAQVPSGACDGLWRVTTAAGTAVSDQAFKTNSPFITAVSPGAAGVGQVVAILGSGFTNASAVSLCLVPSTFTIVSENKITATVPRGACNGRWRVTNATGTGTSDGFALSTPDVAAVSPASAAIGDTVSIFGSGFTGVTAVTECLAATAYTVVSDTKITATVPAGACDGRWRVTTSGGVAAADGAFSILPSLASVAPNSAAVGQTVTLRGTTFSAVTKVSLCLVAAYYTINSDSSITAQVPAGACSGLWRVTNAAGTAVSTTAFSVIPQPAVTSFAPVVSSVGGWVSLIGTGFAGATSVTLCGVNAVFSVVSDQRVDAAVPAGACDGRWRVTTAGGTGASAAAFRTTVPYVMNVSSSAGAAGSSVSLFGSGFAGTTTVTLCFVPAPFTFVSENKITAIVPPGACAGRWRVINSDGTGILETVFTPL
jgi:hypothetical protein